MRIRHDSDKVKEFSQIMLSKYYRTSTKERKGWHRSDSISCPLKGYYRMAGEIQPEYKSRDVGMLLLGTLAHIALHKNFSAQEKVYWLANKVAITVDAIYDKGGKSYPIETKTTRKRIYKKGDLLQSWIEQLAIAMSIMNADVGYLMVMNIINFSLTVWEITMTKEEREMFIHGCIWQILSIAEAVEKKSPSLLTPKTNECRFCPYRPTRTKKGCSYYNPPETKR